MKLFEVTRWGNNVDGPNGPDTNYLVCAHDHEQAAALVRGCEPKLDSITELGACLTTEVLKPVVLRGPYVEHKSDRGTYFTAWSWDDDLGAWIPGAGCPDGEATCYYGNGQLAARCNWKRDRKHGMWERWYANGQLLHRGAYRRDIFVGVHEYWYADGIPAARYEYVRDGVSYRKWHRSGELIADAVEVWKDGNAKSEDSTAEPLG